MTEQRTLVVGTRGSRLALEQTRRVREALDGPSEVLIVRTTGDRFTDKPLHLQGGVGLFTKELEAALLDGRADLAVHSLKDLPVRLSDGLALACRLARGRPEDLLLVRKDALVEEGFLPLKKNSCVGTSSLRRSSLLHRYRPDLRVEPIRGNVPTRLAKLREGRYDAIVLARAGLARLGLDVGELLAFELDPHLWPPAPGQATIAVEIRASDDEASSRLAGLDHEETSLCVDAERSLLETIGAGCQTPFGAYASRGSEGARLSLAAPAPGGGFKLADFQRDSLEKAAEEARAWLLDGCPTDRPIRTEERVWRLARPWC